MPLLLGTAREMLEEVGPTKLSLRAISERVGVSSTAVYHHYSNRAELIDHLAAQGFRELAKVYANREKTGPKQQQLREGCLAYFCFARANPALYQLMFGPECATGEMTLALRTARKEAFDELRKTFADFLELDVETEEVHNTALAAWSYTHGLASLAIHGALQSLENMTDERLMDKTLQGLMHIFKTVRGAAKIPS